MRRQRLVQRLGAQRIGIDALQRFSGGVFGRHQAMLDQQGHEIAAAPKVAVAPPPHSAGGAPAGSIGLFGLRIAPIRKNAHPAWAKAYRVAVGIEPDDEPAQ